MHIDVGNSAVVTFERATKQKKGKLNISLLLEVEVNASIVAKVKQKTANYISRANANEMKGSTAAACKGSKG